MILRFSKFFMLHYNSEAAESMPQATTQAACWITSPLSLLSFTVCRVSEAVHGIPQKVTPWKATPETTTWLVYDSSGFLRLRLSGRNTPTTFSRNFVAADMPGTLAQPRLGSWNRLRLERPATSKTRYYMQYNMNQYIYICILYALYCLIINHWGKLPDNLQYTLLCPLIYGGVQQSFPYTKFIE